MRETMFDVTSPPAETNVEGLSLRDAHKRRTTDLLRRTAIRMFLKRGFDATKAEDIADKAGISVRTLFRYFATKDELVLKGQPAWARDVSASLSAQPGAVPAVQAICEALIAAAGQMDRKSVGAYGKIVDGSQMLRGKAAELLAASIEEIAAAVAARRGLSAPDAASRLLAEVAVAVYQTAVRDWRDGRFAGKLEAVIRERFRMLVSLVDDMALTGTPVTKAARAG